MNWEFKKITTNSYDEIAPILENARYGRCEYTFGTLLMYSEMGEYSYCIKEGVLFVKCKISGRDAFLAPVTDNEEKFSWAISELLALKGENLRLIAVPVTLVDAMGKFDPQTTSEYADYVYDIHEFAELKGKKYHGKRNHISRFERDIGEYSFQKIDESNLSIVREFFEKFKLREEKESDMFGVELCATEKILNDFLHSHQEGYALMTHGQVIGLTIGEVVGDMLFVHVEKCDKTVHGVYEKTANCFVKTMLSKYPNLKFVNREDDGGDEGLRKAKLSYNPLYMAEKDNITFSRG